MGANFAPYLPGFGADFAPYFRDSVQILHPIFWVWEVFNWVLTYFQQSFQQWDFEASSWF